MKYVIIGGGVAGTTVAENLHIFDESADVTLISATETVKRVFNLQQVGEVVSTFDVSDATPESTVYSFIHGVVKGCDFSNKTVLLNDGRLVPYDRLCIATGAAPNVLFASVPNVFGIRDTESVVKLQKRLLDCKHVVVVGNGGIASEFVFATNSCHITWAIKDQTISSVFVDSVASKFLLDSIESDNARSSLDSQNRITKRRIYSTTAQKSSDFQGSALGPDWYQGLSLKGANANKKLDIEYGSEIESVVHTPGANFNLKIKLTTGKTIESDALISATGVIPNSSIFKNKLDISPTDGGIVVNKQLETSQSNVFAVGDVCHIPWSVSDNWKQMRLWTQALHQGFYVARSMTSEPDEQIEPDISFELFTHSTKLFGFKVILLGRYHEWEGCNCYFRITEGVEFIKLVVSGGRVQGALLVGETELEEVMENLILNQLDISQLGESILDPNVDIEDYFD